MELTAKYNLKPKQIFIAELDRCLKLNKNCIQVSFVDISVQTPSKIEEVKTEAKNQNKNKYYSVYSLYVFISPYHRIQILKYIIAVTFAKARISTVYWKGTFSNRPR